MLSTLFNPIEILLRLVLSAFKSNAVCVNVDIGLPRSGTAGHPGVTTVGCPSLSGIGANARRRPIQAPLKVWSVSAPHLPFEVNLVEVWWGGSFSGGGC